MKTITIDKQKELRNNAKMELERLEKIQKNKETVQLLDAFKNKYNICETVYKVVLSAHQEYKGKSNTDFLKVVMTQVPYALTFAGYSFEQQLLNDLFGSKSKNGTTVKKLRDAVTHGMNNKAISEIITRKEELFGYMDEFLSEIKSFDDIAA
jgi:hypothetical protein